MGFPMNERTVLWVRNAEGKTVFLRDYASREEAFAARAWMIPSGGPGWKYAIHHKAAGEYRFRPPEVFRT